MRKLLILFVLAGFLVNCAGTYMTSEQYQQNRKEYKQFEQRKIQENTLKELKKLNKRK